VLGGILNACLAAKRRSWPNRRKTVEKKVKTSNPIARFGRFILFILSSGYLYPHVLTEGMDMKAYDDEIAKTPRS